MNDEDTDRIACKRHTPFHQSDCMACIQADIHFGRNSRTKHNERITELEDEEE